MKLLRGCQKKIQIFGSGSLRKAAVDGEVENEGTVTVGHVNGMLTHKFK